MTSPELWATVALFALLGCGVLNFLMARSVLPMLNALAVAEKVDERIDNRIAKMLDRIRDRQEARKPPPVAGTQGQQVNPLEQLFPGAGPMLEPIMEMPDAGVDMVES